MVGSVMTSSPRGPRVRSWRWSCLLRRVGVARAGLENVVDDAGRCQSGLGEEVGTGAVRDESAGQSQDAYRNGGTGVGEGSGERASGAARTGVVLDGDHQSVVGGEFGELTGYGKDPAGVGDGDAEPVPGQLACRFEGRGGEWPDGHQQNVAETVGVQDVDGAVPVQGGDVGTGGGFGEAQRGGSDRVGDGFTEQFTQPAGIARYGYAHAGDGAEDGQVPHAVMARAVGAGDPGPVQDECDRQPVQGDIHEELVEGAVEE